MPVSPEFNKEIAARIREARIDHKLNQAQMAKALGVSRASVSQWEMGATKPSMTRLRAISQLVGKPIAWFLIADAAAAMAAANSPADDVTNAIRSLPPILREILLDHIDDLKRFEKSVPAWIWKTLPPAGPERDEFILEMKREIWKASQN